MELTFIIAVIAFLAGAAFLTLVWVLPWIRRTRRRTREHEMQLAAALEVNGRYQSAAAGSITLVSADQELNAAAASGLVVDDPNAHP